MIVLRGLAIHALGLAAFVLTVLAKPLFWTGERLLDLAALLNSHARRIAPGANSRVGGGDQSPAGVSVGQGSATRDRNAGSRQ